MEEQLREARRLGWCYSGVIPLGNGEFGQFDSVNERRAFEGLRFAADVMDVAIKPGALKWTDELGMERKYSADARVQTVEDGKVLLEIKPKNVLARDSSLRAKYEAIGRFLLLKGSQRFGLIEWHWHGQLERNISLLSRYWNVDPAGHAVRAFDAMGDCEVALGRILDQFSRDRWPSIWAALFKQQLTADLRAGPLTRQTRVSRPGIVYEPLALADLITTWWA